MEFREFPLCCTSRVLKFGTDHTVRGHMQGLQKLFDPESVYGHDWRRQINAIAYVFAHSAGQKSREALLQKLGFRVAFEGTEKLWVIIAPDMVEGYDKLKKEYL